MTGYLVDVTENLIFLSYSLYGMTLYHCLQLPLNNGRCKVPAIVVAELISVVSHRD